MRILRCCSIMHARNERPLPNAVLEAHYAWRTHRARVCVWARHDDSTRPRHGHDWRDAGCADIAEFPGNVRSGRGRQRSANGDHIVSSVRPQCGARGFAQRERFSAVELIAMGLCDALASDYHYPSPRRAALMLAQDRPAGSGRTPGRLISSGPAAGVWTLSGPWHAWRRESAQTSWSSWMRRTHSGCSYNGRWARQLYVG